jgi:ATP-dependent Lon protease
MNYEESLNRLKEKKEDLEEMSRGGVEEKKYELIKKVIAGYSKSYSGETSSEKIDQIFSEVHGFDEQKKEIKRILLNEKYLKAKKIGSHKKEKNLCFVGPPGTGKTFFSGKFAEALGRKHFVVELSGARSSAIISGGLGQWVGSESGKIIDAIVETQSCDPVVLLDEVDKVGKDKNHGTIIDALLHILDRTKPEFTDRFLDVRIDISRMIFVLTANELKKLPEPLKNRLQIVEIKKYNEQEKFETSKIIIKKIFAEDYENKNKDLFEMKDEALHFLISKVKEPGVRKLEAKINDIID